MDIPKLKVYDLNIELTADITLKYIHTWYDYQIHSIHLPFITIFWMGAPFLDVD